MSSNRLPWLLVLIPLLLLAASLSLYMSRSSTTEDVDSEDRSVVSQAFRRKPSCVLTSGVVDECLAKLNSTLTGNKKAYAERHGYRLLVVHDHFLNQELKHRHPVWGKLTSMLEACSQCDSLLWIDLDALIADTSITIGGLFAKAGAYGRDLLVQQPSTDQMINAGVLGLRCTQRGRRLLQMALNQTQWYQTWPYEQGALNEVITSGRFGLWREAAFISRDDHLLQGLCGFQDGRCLWRRGDFAVHFAPPSCPAPEIERFIKDNPITTS